MPTHGCVYGEAVRRAASALVEGGQRRADGIAECADSARRGVWIVPGAAYGRGQAPGTSMKCCEVL